MSRKFPSMPESVYKEVMQRGSDISSPMHGDTYDLHHALLSRGLVQGLPFDEKKKIHSKYNLLVVPHSMHASHANIPTRQQALRLLLKHYRYTEILGWWNSIKWKSKPPFEFPKEEELADVSPDVSTVSKG